jgi:hypothetical protein
VIFWTALLLICAATVYTGAVTTHMFGHDIFFLLDNGWRVVSGQRPHLDYTSAWGPITFVIIGLGLKLSQFSVNGIGYGNAVFAFLVASWCYLLSRDRLHPSIQIISSLSLAALVAAPYALGTGIFNSSHAMVYNRYGYALLGLIIIEAFSRVPTSGTKNAELSGGASSGAAIALTFFLKASYFLVAVMVLWGISLIGKRLTFRRLLGLVLGFCLVTLPVLAYLDFNINAIFSDLWMAASARSQSLSYQTLIEKAKINFIYYIAILSVVYLIHLMNKGHQSRMRFHKLMLTATLVFVADIILIFTNMQFSELPLLAIFALLVTDDVFLLFKHSQMARSDVLRFSLVILYICFLFLPRLISDLTGIFYGVWQTSHRSEFRPIITFNERRILPLFLCEGENPSSNGKLYTMYINDGAALLRKVTSDTETIITMDMTNPFPYILGRKPPVGGIAAVAYNYTLSDDSRPSDDRYFGSADIVMVPKYPALNGCYYDGYFKIYETGLHKRYFLAAESDRWYLYRRRK